MTAAVAVLGLGLMIACELTVYRFSLWGRQRQVYRAIGAVGAVAGSLAVVVGVVRLWA